MSRSALTVSTRYGAQRVVRRKGDANLWAALNRAARRPYGRGARVWAWVSNGWEVDREGNLVGKHLKATVVGPRERDGGCPILGDAYVWLTAEEVRQTGA